MGQSLLIGSGGSNIAHVAEVYKYDQNNNSNYNWNHTFTAEESGLYVVNLDAEADAGRVGTVETNGYLLFKNISSSRVLTGNISFCYLTKGQTITLTAKGSNNFQNLHVGIYKVF